MARPNASNGKDDGGNLGRSAVAYLSQAFVVAGVLFYFGWVRASATFEYFGLSMSALGLGTTEYILRSGSSVFTPLVVLAVAVAGGTMLDTRVAAMRAKTSRTRTVIFVTILSTALVGGYALRPMVAPFVYTSLLLAATFLVMTSRTLKRCRVYPPTILIGTIGLLVVALLFRAVGDQAAAVGTSAALRLANDLPNRPELTLSSRVALPVEDGGGIISTVTGGPDQPYRYRIKGFRLLMSSGGTLYLVRPYDPKNGLFVLPGNLGVLVQVSARR